MTNKECVTCNHLGRCSRTDAKKVLEHFVCEHFEEVQHPEIWRARCTTISTFGEAGLKAILSPENSEEPT